MVGKKPAHPTLFRAGSNSGDIDEVVGWVRLFVPTVLEEGNRVLFPENTSESEFMPVQGAYLI
jgi:hypothetical protein